MAKKIQLGYKDIESRLAALKTHEVKPADVGYEILMAFGKSEKDVSRYREGKGVLKTFDGLLIKGLFCYCAVDTVRLTECLENLKCDEQVRKAAPKIIAVSDGKTVLAYDTRENDTYEQLLAKMHSDFAFFYPLMNVERIHNTEENPADVKAAEKLAKLHDEIRAYNEYNSDDDLHDLNIFITRLLFCFFAEDTGIFAENLFTNFIRRFTKNDGSDLSDMIGQAFRVMNVKDKDRSEDTTKEIDDFPYVNGGLFATDIPIPQMGYKARKIILECGDLNWKDINPDIFGSMIQAVVNPDVRAKEGMHYTSVPNIMKVINPLFMDDLRGEYNRLADAYNQKKSLYEMSANTRYQFFNECKPIIKGCNKLLTRMSKMKFFDPACGSGNFLIITYKQLRLLEMEILKLRMKCQPEQMLDFIDASCIRIDQFYGIELLDFPHEVAMLSLWLAEHQMNNKFHADFGVNVAALPLHNINQIKCGNACRVDWEEVCPHTKEEEVFVFGNPPYLGSKLQTNEQKDDIAHVFGKIKNSKILDYITIWFYLGAKYIKETKAEFAYVSTNSICQGEQVAVLWSLILSMNEEISFAHTSFKWANNAKYNAGVTVIVVGVSNKNKSTKHLYTTDKQISTPTINPYLSIGTSTIVHKEIHTPKGYPKLCFGCMPYDGGNLLMDSAEYEDFIAKYSSDSHYLRLMYGSEEFINGKPRHCLWIDDNEAEDALRNEEIARRVERTRNLRLDSTDTSCLKLAERPYQFREHPDLDREKIIIPSVSSERRKYIPIGYLDKGTVVSNLAFAIYDASLWLFGILTSEMHMTWVRTVGGRLKTDYRYSAGLCYNTFPFPTLSDTKKSEIEEAATNVLLARANYPEKTLADLYDPDKMPEGLREAHEELDRIVESCYPGAPFANDEARLECLFRLYEKMTANKK
ncbi:DNA methyltransferase [uncultured Prevotella sp.]|uniref:class I SAM-dependent DNA methyltransferase n=1 Tax=uncultured Prevotella sp. TaxID=159272 RepID=UPI0027E2FB3F|nr:DNA methyltransferase [uncultured Prevotella sp.]